MRYLDFWDLRSGQVLRLKKGGHLKVAGHGGGETLLVKRWSERTHQYSDNLSITYSALNQVIKE